MQGKIINQNGTWQIETEKGSIDVHKSCAHDLNEDMVGDRVQYVIVKDFTGSNQGKQYAVPII